MSDSLKLPLPIRTTGRTEWKVKAAALGTYVAALAGAVFLGTTATDYVHALPDWLEAVVYPAIPAAVSLLAGRAARTRPDYISASTAEAVEAELRRRMPRV